MQIQCRVCHQITPADIPQLQSASDPIANLMGMMESRMWFGGDRIVLPLACGHGEYRGFRPIGGEPIRFEPALKEGTMPRWTWEWWDTTALAQEQAERGYGRTQPALEAWDPPLLTLICTCGQPLTTQGVTEEDNEYGAFEGWEGTCAECGTVVRVKYGGLIEKTYRQERADRHRESVTLWDAFSPLAPKPLAVAGLLESEDV